MVRQGQPDPSRPSRKWYVAAALTRASRWLPLLGLPFTALVGLLAYPLLTKQPLVGADYFWGSMFGGAVGVAASPELTRLANALTHESNPDTFLLRARSTRAARAAALAFWLGCLWLIVAGAHDRILPIGAWAKPPALIAFVALLLFASSEVTSYFTLELRARELTILGKTYLRSGFHHVSHNVVGKTFVFYDQTFRAFSSGFGAAQLDRAVAAVEAWSRQPTVRRSERP